MLKLSCTKNTRLKISGQKYELLLKLDMFFLAIKYITCCKKQDKEVGLVPHVESGALEKLMIFEMKPAAFLYSVLLYLSPTLVFIFTQKESKTSFQYFILIFMV